MSEQEREENQPVGAGGDTPTGVGADRIRRRLTAAGLGAPVIMTLASRPVFGAQCLSNMMSGNLSNPDRGTCALGVSPGYWKTPVGKIMGYDGVTAWSMAGLSYGTLVARSSPNKWDSYTGGTQCSATGILVPTGAASTISMREVLNLYPGSIQFHLLAAYLNARFSEKTKLFQYILTTDQVLGLGSGAIPVPSGYLDLKAFLNSTWT